MPRYEYRISSIRYDNEQFENQIDKLLITVAYSKKEACDIFERLITEAGFKHVDKTMKWLRGKKWTYGTTCSSLTENFHGYLGPGGYLIEKIEVG